MIKRALVFLFVFFYLIGCGYVPMYSNKINLDFSISNLEVDGNRDINKIIENKLKSYFNNGSSKTYNIKINTSYKKVSAAKDATGNTTDFI